MVDADMIRSSGEGSRDAPYAIETQARHSNDERARSTANGAILASPSHIYKERV